MLRKILSAHNDWTGLILRLTLGLVMFPHGAQNCLAGSADTALPEP